MLRRLCGTRSTNDLLGVFPASSASAEHASYERLHACGPYGLSRVMSPSSGKVADASPTLTAPKL
jgi:hypothetical protein